jgi:hypothetical protein
MAGKFQNTVPLVISLVLNIESCSSLLQWVYAAAGGWKAARWKTEETG